MENLFQSGDSVNRLRNSARKVLPLLASDSPRSVYVANISTILADVSLFSSDEARIFVRSFWSLFYSEHQKLGLHFSESEVLERLIFGRTYEAAQLCLFLTKERPSPLVLENLAYANGAFRLLSSAVLLSEMNRLKSEGGGEGNKYSVFHFAIRENVSDEEGATFLRRKLSEKEHELTCAQLMPLHEVAIRAIEVNRPRILNEICVQIKRTGFSLNREVKMKRNGPFNVPLLSIKGNSTTFLVSPRTLIMAALLLGRNDCVKVLMTHGAVLPKKKQMFEHLKQLKACLAQAGDEACFNRAKRNLVSIIEKISFDKTALITERRKKERL